MIKINLIVDAFQIKYRLAEPPEYMRFRLLYN